MTAQLQREQRITELRRKAEQHRDQASAFEAAADLLDETEPTHRRFRSDWASISKRLRNDARLLNGVAEKFESDIARLTEHAVAASRATATEVTA